MANIRNTSEIAEKWSRVTPQRVDDFKSGVQRPRVDWSTQTQASKDAWSAGVTEAINQDRFSRGVAEAGTPKWQSKTLGKGVARWPSGVREAGPDFAKGFEPFRETIAAVTLPPRFAKGDPRNFERVVAIGTALHQRKIGR